MNHYIYVGNRNNVRLFYGIESKEFYYEEKSVVSSGMLIPLFTFITTVSYAIVRKLNDFTLVYNKEIFILVSAILGLLLSAFLMRAARKSENEFFSKSQPVEIVEQWEIGKIVFEAKKITLIYIFSRIVLLFLVIITPVIIEIQQDIILFLSYFLLWTATGYLYFYFNLKERRKAIKEIKLRYCK